MGEIRSEYFFCEYFGEKKKYFFCDYFGKKYRVTKSLWIQLYHIINYSIQLGSWPEDQHYIGKISLSGAVHDT